MIQKMRGRAQIQAAMPEAQKAATRNGYKGDWRRTPLKTLFDKLYEELDEYYEAVLSGDPQRIREELGDVLWVAIMIADHDLMLVDLEVVNESLQKLWIRSAVDKAREWKDHAGRCLSSRKR